jgi:uncharacterized protein
LSDASTLVVAALSARVLAEAAVQAGHRVLALDCFGDVDTQRASLKWWPINDPGRLRIAPQRFLSALAAVAKQPGVQGWVAGAGFEDQPALLAQGAKLLPLIGMGADEVRRLRDAKTFFACLDRAQIAHPDLRWTLPADRHGWWVKAAGGCGGWHIRAASHLRSRRRLPAGRYAQRDAAGTPMSATLLGDGQHIQLLGINRQIMQRTAQHPFVYAGVVGPVAVPPGVVPQIEHIAQHLATTLRWRGLVSLDFLLDGDAVQVLELNPRPPASLVLYPGALAAHVAVCRGGRVPANPWRVDGVRGQRIVLAPCAVRLNADIAQQLAESLHVHDLPQPGQEFKVGDPLCSVQVHGHDQAHSAHAASALLQHRHDDVLNLLENLQ